MMRRGRGKSSMQRRQFVCHKCGATPPWSAAQSHQKKCTKTNRHREDRS